MPHPKRITGLFFLFLLLFLPACAPRQESARADSVWRISDLRALQAPDAPDPTRDLVAAYARVTATDLELRFDFLGSPEAYDYDLYVVVDDGAGKAGRLPINVPAGEKWSFTLGFPARGLPRAFDPDGAPVNIRPRILRDGELDAATARISLRELAQVTGGDARQMSFRAFLTRPGETAVEDQIGARVSGAPPAVQARLLLAFWDSLPAATPAQALRRWDGAHTGPYGQRHGLDVLLQAARQSGVPLALLDLKQPESLSALDALGGLAQARQMANDNLLLLADTLPGDPQDGPTKLANSIQAAKAYQLPSSAFLYGAAASVQETAPFNAYQAVFARLQDADHLRQWGKLRLIPLPNGPLADDEQANEQGLSTAARQALLNTALSGDPSRLVVLGGPLPTSPWGDSLIAGPAFRYIAGHPWIHVLKGADLLNFSALAGVPDCADLLCLSQPGAAEAQKNAEQEAAERQTAAVRQAVRQALRTAPDGFLTGLAWQMEQKLTSPTSDARLQALRAGYLGQVGPLLEAARWAAAPIERSDCSADLDWDGAKECVLASRSLFLVLDPQGGRLVLAAALNGKTALELVGPHSQFVVGLGDRLEWRPEEGLAGDPQEIPGAFADAAPDTFQPYQAEAQPGQVTLTRAAGGQRKVFKLTGQGFQVSVENGAASATQIPLALVSPLTGAPGGYARYRGGPLAAQHGSVPNPPYTGWSWELKGSGQVRITTQGATLTPQAFAESLPLLLKPEDPNFDYPPGHYLPFPMAVVGLQAQGNYEVDFVIN